MLHNYHAHTFRCLHAYDSEEDCILAAANDGFATFGFADHTPWPYKSDFVAGMRMRAIELEDYVFTLRALREKHKDRVRVLIGLECEGFPEFYAWLDEVREKYALDYLILGNHYDTSDEHNGGFYFGRCETGAHVRRYAETTIAAMETGRFMYLAHPDLFLHRYPAFDEEAGRACREICETAKRIGLPLEYNLLGEARHKTDQAAGCIGYTSEPFWNIAAETGCLRAVIGADAHNAKEAACAERFRSAKAKLEGLGIEVIDRII